MLARAANVTDVSWFPSHSYGGVFAIVCSHIGFYSVYQVHIPMVSDQSFTVETYIAWVLLTVCTRLRGKNAGVWGRCWDSDSTTFTDSKSYIEVLVAR